MPLVFIAGYELPALLASAERGELRIFPVIVSPCDHQPVTELYQAVNDPAHPLQTTNQPGRCAVWERLITGLTEVGAGITDGIHIAAEMKRWKMMLPTWQQ